MNMVMNVVKLHCDWLQIDSAVTNDLTSFVRQILSFQSRMLAVQSGGATRLLAVFSLENSFLTVQVEVNVESFMLTKL